MIENSSYISNTLNTVPKYPRDVQFLSQYMILAKQNNILLGEYSLFKIKHFIKYLETMGEDEFLKSYYYSLDSSLEYLSVSTGILKELLFLDLHNSIELPIILRNTEIRVMSMDSILKHLNILDTINEKRNYLIAYYIKP